MPIIQPLDVPLNDIGVYVIESEYTGMVYVGSSFNVSRRLTSHEWGLFNKIHNNKKLQKEYDLGHILNTSAIRFHSRSEAYDYEKELLEQLWGSNQCLNLSKHTGKRDHNYSDEQKASFKNINLGRKASSETKALMSSKRKGIKPHQNTISAIIKTWTGKKHMESSILKMKNSHPRYPFTIDDVRYEKLQDASAVIRVSPGTIHSRLHSKNFTNYQYV